MPRATLASRQLKNNDTGIDLFVPSYREVQGLLSSTVYYQVVLVSKLACFKAPSHKETDVVQYSFEKPWAEFEELRTKIGELFHGTVLPALNKKSIIVNEHVLRERRNNLDQFLKFVASANKLATCVPVLEFLGIDSGRAKRFSQGEPLESAPKSSSDTPQEDSAEVNEPEVLIFEENVRDQTDSDLFGAGDDDDEALFVADSSKAQVSMFEQQDLKRELTEEDEKDFGFIPDAIITKREIITIGLGDDEDDSDLFKIEDDLDKLMTIKVGKQEKQPHSKVPELQLSPSPAEKPTIPVKPSVPLKPRPPAKPVLGKPVSQDASKVSAKQLPDKSAPSDQSKLQSDGGHVGSSQHTTGDEHSFLSETGNIGEGGSVDDIIKYLRENSSANTDDVDLFS